jgi:hypothetical protein
LEIQKIKSKGKQNMSDIKFVKRLNAVPQVDTNIFTVKAPSVTMPILAQAAQKLNLKGDEKNGRFTIDENTMTYLEGPHQIQLYRKSEAIKYVDTSRWHVDDGVSTVAIPDAKAIELAKAYVQKTALVPLDQCDVLKVTHLVVGSLEKGTNKAVERTIDAAVVFQRKIGNVPVEGPGGKAVVFLNHNSEVVGFEKIWRTTDQVFKKVPFKELRPLQFAEQEMVTYWNRLGKKVIEVQDQRFGYFELGRNETQTYLQPAYIMPIKIASIPEGKGVMKSYHITLAATAAVGTIMPEVKPVVPMPVRR